MNNISDYGPDSVVQKTRGAVKQNPNCAFHKHYSAVRAVVAVYIITPPWPGGGKGAALEIWSRTLHTLLTVKLSKNIFFKLQSGHRFGRLLPMVYPLDIFREHERKK